MRLEYKILWLDDEIQQLFIEDEHIIEIEKFISNYGFIPIIKTVDNSTDFFYNLNHSYDLILTDYHMNDMNGDKVVEKIRSSEYAVMTEVLFYTAQADLKDTQKIDRVSFLETNKPTGSHQDLVIKKLKNLIFLTIRKTQDINNLRGLVMAETSELDEMMKKILEKIFEKGLVKDKKIIRRKKSLQEFYTSNISDLENFNLPNDFLDFLSSKHFSSFSFYSSLCGFSSCDKNTIQKNSITPYKEEIINMRNKLAHQSEFETLNDDDFIRIRENIQKYKNIFQKIINELSSL